MLGPQSGGGAPPPAARRHPKPSQQAHRANAAAAHAKTAEASFASLVSTEAQTQTPPQFPNPDWKRRPTGPHRPLSRSRAV